MADKEEIRLRKYLGIISILILIATYLILQSLVGKQIGHLWIWIIVIGYLASALASWYSKSGFWRQRISDYFDCTTCGISCNYSFIYDWSEINDKVNELVSRF